MDSLASRTKRIWRLIEAGRTLADPASALGRIAREQLPPATGLSPEGVDFAFAQSLEIDATPLEIELLCRGAPAAPRAHVVLSANVFVAAFRALALALAASPSVSVRCSRREAVTAQLLQSAGADFEIVDELEPKSGDHVWAYGSDTTIASLRRSLPRGVVFHGHGSGIGLAVVSLGGHEELDRAASALAEDVASFDQRGCLSPRLVLAEAGIAQSFAERISRALAELEKRVPRGALTPDEAADERRFRDSAAFAFEVFDAGSAVVTLDQNAKWVIPPPGRNLHVTGVAGIPALADLRASVVALGVSAPEAWVEELRRLLPRARVSALGSMQRPRLDGPVDLRTEAAGESLSD